MTFTREQIRTAAAAVALDPSSTERLLAALPPSGAPATSEAPRFDLTHVLWYGGALIIIGAMSLFASLAFAQLGGGMLTGIALAYAAIFAIAGEAFWRKGLRTPGGLMFAIAIAMAPLAIYGVQHAFGLWGTFEDPGNYRDFFRWVRGGWLPMEVATILAGIVALWYRRFAFIVAIVAFALWFLSMDLTAWVFQTDDFTWDQRKIVSMWFGVAVIIVAWAVDRVQSRGDFAFWLHLVGVVTFWGGLTLQESDSEVSKALYCLLNVGLVMASVFLMRRVYSVFGVLGICLYLGHLASDVFEDSLLFPFALSAIGVLVIVAGVWLHRSRAGFDAWMGSHLPEGMRRLRPSHARQ
jgi:hypothetical protein